MFSNPKLRDQPFQALRAECAKRQLRLYLAVNFRVYISIGGNYAAYCSFSDKQLCAGESLQEIADFLRIGGVYD
jgi:hypothetical protein